MKNRFSDILPFDSSRVELPSTKDDYINASFVKNLGHSCPSFIITQAPLPSTYADFWIMVLEKQIELVICLLADSQMSGEIYWAVSKNEDLVIGRVKVSLQSCNIRSYWVERIMSVTDGKVTRVVVHLQFTAWPQRWFPESPGPLLCLVSETLSLWSAQGRCRASVVVHCDSGAGRSGCFVVAAAFVAELQSSNAAARLPDPVVVTAAVARQRKNPLRDRDHLKFVYQCLLYYAQDMLMKRGILASKSTFDEKRTKQKSHTRHPSEDFLLNSLKEPSQFNMEERRASDASSTGSLKPNDSDPLSQIDPLWPIKRYS
ncbi:hypothetical protein AAG570_001197 [Ranatra chinensis]|uniref:Protein tyrosine phosphatase n=1 Tax=Ranatra chinensis TaxID=642074 RepID=A0ABD0YTR7_9HEMI